MLNIKGNIIKKTKKAKKIVNNNLFIDENKLYVLGGKNENNDVKNFYINLNDYSVEDINYDIKNSSAICEFDSYLFI